MARSTRYSKGTVALLVFAVIMTPLLVGLGLWQLNRADEKQAVIDLQAEGEQSKNIKLTTLITVDWTHQTSANETLNYKRVDVKGRYDSRIYLLLDNRTRNGKVGYEVINLFRTDDGKAIWVNRGWIKAPVYRDQWPEIKPVTGVVAITGSVYLTSGQNFTLAADEATDQWPRRVQGIDINTLNTELKHDSYPFTLRLIDDAQPGALQTGWRLATMSPEKHFGYAFQWFSLALLLVVMTTFAIAKNNTDEAAQSYDA